MTRRPLLIALALASLGLVACGDSEPRVVSAGESEAAYVTLGATQYQVQISRQLNPSEVRDRANLIGIPPADRGLDAQEIWFGVWVRAFNRSERSERSADEFKIVDTRGHEYEPIALQPVNAFAYRSSLLQPGSEYPAPGSAAAETSSTGALLLFKLPVDALSFRPLEFEFSSAALSGETSSITLDV